MPFLDLGHIHAPLKAEIPRRHRRAHRRPRLHRRQPRPSRRPAPCRCTPVFGLDELDAVADAVRLDEVDAVADAVRRFFGR
jgi:hypothetical protein